MVKLNGFITNSQQQYERFLDRLCDNSTPMTDPVLISDENYQAALATLLSQLYIIMKNDPDKIPTLKLPQQLQDQLIGSQPKGAADEKKKTRKKKGHHADAATTASSAAAPSASTTDESAMLLHQAGDIPPPPPI
jgi:hypothetical protein